MTGSQFVIDFFSARGIERVFAYPGANVLPLYCDLAANRQMKTVLVRHEQNAAFAACGYSKASGRVGVCVATSGPGATNLITGITDAYLDSAPLIAVTGQVNRSFIGRDAFQEADIMGMTIPVTKHNYLVKDIHELPRILDEAYIIATTGRKGPVLVDITHDVFTSQICEDSETVSDYSPEKKNTYHQKNYSLEMQMDSIREALANSYRPLILAGGGVVSAHASFELGEFSKKSGIPVAVTLMGKGIVLPDGCANLGMAGVFGTDEANSALSQCDLLIAAGTRFSDRTIQNYTLFSRARTVIHCDIDPAEIDKNVEADIGVVSDAAVFISALTSLCGEHPVCAVKSFDYYKLKIPDKNLTPVFDDRAVMNIISDCISNNKINALYVTDVGDNQMAAARCLTPVIERGFITTGGLGAMGFGLPAGIGATMAVRDADPLDGLSKITHTIIISGDGGFQMTMQELSTLKNIDFPVILVIVDNSSLGMIEHLTGDSANFQLQNPDFAALASAYGIDVSSAENADDFRTAFCIALKRSAPCVIVAKTVI